MIKVPGSCVSTVWKYPESDETDSYSVSWLAGNGCPPIDDSGEDLELSGIVIDGPLEEIVTLARQIASADTAGKAAAADFLADAFARLDSLPA